MISCDYSSHLTATKVPGCKTNLSEGQNEQNCLMRQKGIQLSFYLLTKAISRKIINKENHLTLQPIVLNSSHSAGSEFVTCQNLNIALQIDWNSFVQFIPEVNSKNHTI